MQEKSYDSGFLLLNEALIKEDICQLKLRLSLILANILYDIGIIGKL